MSLDLFVLQFVTTLYRPKVYNVLFLFLCTTLKSVVATLETTMLPFADSL